MTVGFPDTKAAIDNQAGSLALNIRNLLGSIQTFNTYLGSRPDPELVALGYTQTEVTLLKAAFTDLNALRLVATGLQTQPAVNNFLFNSNKIVGPN